MGNMSQFIFGIFGGTALLMYGVDLMGDGLERMSGSMMKKFLQKVTGKLWKAFLVGIFLTALVQSSTAISVLSVGFVNSGILELPQAIGIIYGANIGTTITAQFMALSFSFNLVKLALPIIAAGFVLHTFFNQDKFKNIGQAVMGIGFMLLGLTILNQGIPFMQENATIRGFFEHYASNIFIGILLGIVTTALVHSSAATVGIVMLLGSAGLLNLTSAIALMFGDNIGTSVTALLASTRGNTNAKRTAWGHALHNIIGVVIVLPFLPLFTRFIEYFTQVTQGSTDIQLQIANSHTLFNVIVALIFLPLNNYFVKLLTTIVKDRKAPQLQREVFIDPLLLDTPSAALDAARKEVRRALITDGDMLKKTLEDLSSNGKDAAPLIRGNLATMNLLQRDLTNYMVELSQNALTASDSTMLPGIIKAASYLERIAEHTSHLYTLQTARAERELHFTPEALAELQDLGEHLLEMIRLTRCNLESYGEDCHNEVKTLDLAMDTLTARYSENHVRRLENGQCSIEASLIYLEILPVMERIGSYLYKISRLCKYELNGLPAPTN